MSRPLFPPDQLATPAAADCDALDRIRNLLRDPDWAGTALLRAIADIVRESGRNLDPMPTCTACGLTSDGDICGAPGEAAEWDGPIAYRVKYEDRQGEAVGDHDAFPCLVSAFRHFRAVISGQDHQGLGSVYVTEDDVDDEHVIATHRFR